LKSVYYIENKKYSCYEVLAADLKECTRIEYYHIIFTNPIS